MNPLELLKRAQYGSPNSWSRCLSLQPRNYSICSPILTDWGNCTPTWGVLDKESIQGCEQFLDFASYCLPTLQEGDRILVIVWSSHKPFHLRKGAADMALIMVCTGTGMIAFRGFVHGYAKMLAIFLPPFISCQEPEKVSFTQPKWQSGPPGEL